MQLLPKKKPASAQRVSLGGLAQSGVQCMAQLAAGGRGGARGRRVARMGRASGASHTGGWGGTGEWRVSRYTAAGAGELIDGVDQCHQQAHRGGCGHRAGSRARAQSRARAGRAVAATMGAPLSGTRGGPAAKNASTAEGVPARRSSRGGIISGHVRFHTRPSSGQCAGELAFRHACGGEARPSKRRQTVNL